VLPPEPPAWSRDLQTVGVTGTNGKTTTTALTASALGLHHGPVARVTTVGAFLDEHRLDLPESFDGFLAALQSGLDGGGRYAAIELTSEALALGFAKAWPCSVGVFTNLTRDHLDAHGSAEHYLASKAQLFVHLPADGAAVLNGCDPASELLAEVTPPGVRVIRYGVPSRGPATGALDLRGVAVHYDWTGTQVSVKIEGDLAAELGVDQIELRVRAIGAVQAENALAAFGAAAALGVPPEVACRGLLQAPRPPGRFEPIAEQPRVVVDYAHTPDALRRTLGAARDLCSGRLWVVFGAGGERDQAKRAPMGQAASVADRVVITSDNPRGEDPAEIAAAVRRGVEPPARVELELDRRTAIRGALASAGPEDLVVIAGKGHETTQRIGGEVRALDDREIVRQALRT
jgi:UDP-N-acetylmuramoyl-L-alanyl-D-glutamate--2,6-diaminopimelate ligase